MKYKLQKLFKEHNITGICLDSRKAKPGFAFFAIAGEDLDGNQFIEKAFNLGASIAFTENKVYINDRVIHVENITEALVEAASIFYPNSPSNLIAVTGTNGKSSVVSYCKQILQALRVNAASIGTLGVECSDCSLQQKFNDEKYTSLTTPDIITFKKILNDLAKYDVTHVAFEASSHSLQQERVYGIKVKSAAFTSFSQDHLDYHKTMYDYLQSKLKLFLQLESDGSAVINSDIEEFPIIQDFLNHHSIHFQTVGSSGDIKVLETIQSLDGQIVTFSYLSKDYSFETNIIGSFQASNILIAALLVHNCGFEFDKIVQVLPNLISVKGRLQRVTTIDSKFHIFVDYAHTPNALENSLIELRKIKQPGGQLVVLFGCGGNRDTGKRAIMGNIASRFADYVIITDDNPRKEDPDNIRKDILSGCNLQTKEVGDRREAIFQAINDLKDCDILLVAGKGHENYQIIQDQKLHFDDVEVVEEALKASKTK